MWKGEVSGRGLYKGMLASMLGVIPYSGVELMVYSYLTVWVGRGLET